MATQIIKNQSANLIKGVLAHFSQASLRNASVRQARGLFERAQGRMTAHEAQALRAQALAALSVVR
jgi:hypothetical protein